MRARVDSAITLDASEVSPKITERLRAALSFPNPARLERLRLGLGTGSEPERLCLLGEHEGELRIPRGAIHTLRRLARAEGDEVRCEDRRIAPPVPSLKGPSLREYQAAAVEKLRTATQGLVVLPCGGGKTRLGIGAIARLETTALVLVPTVDLADQWTREIRGLLGVAPGFIGDGEAERRQITVALVQTLAGWHETDLDRLLGGFGLLIVDEAHHVPASTFRAVVDRSPARYRLGLTATPEREDGLTPLLELFLGPVLLQVTHAALVQAGVLTMPGVRSVETDFEFPYRSAEDFAPMLDALVADEARSELIVSLVANEARAGHLCLVLSGRVDHCEALAAALSAAGVSSAALTGRVPRARRRQILEHASEGDLSAIVATTVADEGLDLPRLSRVFLVFPGRARGPTIQRLGRLMRPHASKADAVLFDLVDCRVPILRRHHLERRRLYSEILGLPASSLSRRAAS